MMGLTGTGWSKMALLQTFLALVCAIIGPSLGASVPVIYWSSAKASSHHLTDVLAGQTLSAKGAFEDYIKPFLKKAQDDLTVMFILDQLSMEDFRKHSSSFTHLARASQESQAVALPLVSADNLHSVPEFVRENFGGLVKDVYSSELYAWLSVPSIPESCRLIVIHLPPVAGSSDIARSDVLRDNDLLMQKALRVFEGKMITVSVLVTALAPSEKILHLQSAEELTASESLAPRHLLTTGAVEKKSSRLFNVSDCLYMSFDGIIFSSDNVSASMMNSTMTVSGSGCNEIILIAAKNATEVHPGELATLTVRLVFANKTSGDWTCVNASSSAEFVGNVTKNSSLSCGSSRLDDLQLAIYAPTHMSYVCMNTTLTDVNGTVRVSFSNLQIQPYATPRKWGGVFNCATFFTLPILSALFVTLLLASGMIIGLLTISAIQTPDRFDDPKGPMISVPQQE